MTDGAKELRRTARKLLEKAKKHSRGLLAAAAFLESLDRKPVKRKRRVKKRKK